MSQQNPIRVGLAAFGASGRIFHAPFLHADPHFELRKVCERTAERSKEEYPYVEVVRSFEELLTEDIDLVVVCTPNPLHVPMTKQAIAAGKHVVVEKPAAATAGEAEELCRLAEEQHVVFSVYQNRRLDGDFLTVKKLIDEGRLGEVVDYTCHYDRFVQGAYPKAWKQAGGQGVNILYDLGIHIIDQAMTLFGLPEEVSADLWQQRPESPGIDKITVTLYYPDKRAVLSAGEVVAMPGPRFAVNGRKGTYLKYGLDVQEARLQKGMRPAGDPQWGQDDPASYGKLYTPTADGIREETIPTETGCYGRYYDNLYQAIRHGAPLLVKPQEAAAVLRVVEAAMESNQEKRRVQLAW